MGVGVVAVVFFDDGHDFFAGEVIDHLTNHFVVVRKCKIHCITSLSWECVGEYGRISAAPKL